jgi:hypothetical protein
MPVSTFDRGELEDAWRARVENSRLRYQEATTRYGELLKQQRDGPESPLAHARHAESAALVEYLRVLRLFTDLIVQGKLPETGS